MLSPSRPGMKPEEFRLIKEFALEKYGIVIDDTKENFLSREIGHRLKILRLSNFSDYYAYLKYSPANGSESDNFISLVTNNETTFFREELQLNVFAGDILPGLKERKLASGDRKIRIVSAGCSTGEEVYTLAMLLLDSGLFIWDWDVRITGIDLDADALKKAERAIYSGRAFQSTPAHFLDRYFRKCDDGFAVRDIVKKITTFLQGNLLEFEKAVREEVDLIFCRNVLIYFEDSTIQRVVESFSRVLSREGFLFLGHSESLARITDRYVPVRFPGTIIYRNRD